MGRCAGYLMRNREEAFSVFVHADMETRIERVKERDHITSRMKAKRKIQDVDEKRSAFRKARNGECRRIMIFRSALQSCPMNRQQI